MPNTPTARASSGTPVIAIACAIILVLPGLFVGKQAAEGYLAIIDAAPNVISAGSWMLSFDALWLKFVPEFIRGAIATAAALWLTFVCFRRADRNAVRSSTLIACLVLAAALLILSVAQYGVGDNVYQFLGLMAGLVFGGALTNEIWTPTEI